MNIKYRVAIGALALIFVGIICIVLHREDRLDATGPALGASVEWKTYTNKQAGYSVAYPGDLAVVPQDGLGIPSTVSISDPDTGYYYISIRVSTTTAASPEQWLSEEDKRNGTHSVIDQQRTIAGKQAIVIHEDDGEPDLGNPSAIVITDGKAYQIAARGLDLTRVWNSFSIR